MKTAVSLYRPDEHRDSALHYRQDVIGSPHNSAGGGAWRDEYLRRAILGEMTRNLIGSDERML